MKPSEHKSVQAWYVQEICWSVVLRDEAELRREKKNGGQ